MARGGCACHCRCCLKRHARKRREDRTAFIEARLDGLCGCCRKQPAADGYRTCTPCREASLSRWRASQA